MCFHNLSFIAFVPPLFRTLTVDTSQLLCIYRQKNNNKKNIKSVSNDLPASSHKYRAQYRLPWYMRWRRHLLRLICLHPPRLLFLHLRHYHQSQNLAGFISPSRIQYDPRSLSTCLACLSPATAHLAYLFLLLLLLLLLPTCILHPTTLLILSLNFRWLPITWTGIPLSKSSTLDVI